MSYVDCVVKKLDVVSNRGDIYNFFCYFWLMEVCYDKFKDLEYDVYIVE